MKFINNTTGIVRLDTWVCTDGLATIKSVIVKPNAEYEFIDQCSMYDVDYVYIGCLYDKPSTHKQVYCYIDALNYQVKITEAGSVAILLNCFC
jgi:hypothetical protein